MVECDVCGYAFLHVWEFTYNIHYIIEVAASTTNTLQHYGSSPSAL